MSRIALTAPLSLKDPMGWRFSSLRWIRAGPASRGTSGVRTTRPGRRRRAWTISSGPGGSMAGIAPPPQLDRRARARLERLHVHVMRRGQVLDREPQRLEEGDLVRRAPPGHPAQEHFPDLAHDVVLSDRPLGARD